MLAALIPPILAFIAALAGAYLGAYLKKKGENLATHEDLSALVTQLEKTTAATKAVEAKIDNEVWNGQRIWELKKEAALEVVSTLLKLDDKLAMYSMLLRVVNMEPRSPAQLADAKRVAGEEMNAAFGNFASKRALAVLVCSNELTEPDAKSRA